MIGGGHRQARLDEQRRQHVGQDVADGDPQRRAAERARGLDVVLRLDREHGAAGEADEDGQGRDADGDHGVAETRAEEGGQRDGHDEERDGEHRVGHAHDEVVDPPASVPREEAEGNAER